MHKIDIVGLDLAKNIFQVHAIAADGARWLGSAKCAGHRC